MKLLGCRLEVLIPMIIIAFVYMFYFSRRSKLISSMARSFRSQIQMPPLKDNVEDFINEFPIHPSTTLCKSCGKKNPSMNIVMLIFSHADNYDLRIRSRYTVTSETLASMNTTRIFLLGGIPEGDRIITQPEIIDEARIYGDILQVNFIESYKNLTHKHLMGLRWISTFCEQTAFIVKTNDNANFSIRLLVDLLHNLWHTKAHEDLFIMGFIRDVPQKYRPALVKWYSLRNNSSQRIHLPPYLSGCLYFTTPTVAGLLADEANHYPYFWKDDVFVTGVLANKLQLRLWEIPSNVYVTLHFNF